MPYNSSFSHCRKRKRRCWKLRKQWRVRWSKSLACWGSWITSKKALYFERVFIPRDVSVSCSLCKKGLELQGRGMISSNITLYEDTDVGTQHKMWAGAAFPGFQGKLDGLPYVMPWRVADVLLWAMSLSRSAARLTQKALGRFQGKEPFSSLMEENEEATILSVLKRLYTGNCFTWLCLFPKTKLMPELDQNPLQCPVLPSDLWGSVCVYLTAQGGAAPSLDYFLL